MSEKVHINMQPLVNPLKRILIFLITLVCFSHSSEATATRVWENSTARDFSRGSFLGSILSSRGTVLLGQTTSPLNTGETAIWSSCVDSKGRIYLGTGHRGRLFRLENGTLKKVLETDSMMISSLVVGPKDEIYASTVPGGKIYKILPDGSSKLFARLPDPYVWALHQMGDSLYAGTGPEGVIYRVDSQGAATPFFDSREKNILSLASDSKGRILAGTDPNGLLLGLEPTGEARILADLEETEIRRIGVRGDDIYLAANKANEFDNSKFVQTLAKEIRKEETSGKAADRKVLVERLLSAAIYQLSPDGRLEQWLSLSKNFVGDLLVLDSGNTYIGTGVDGRVYRLVKPDHQVLEHEFEEAQILSLIAQGGRLSHIGTGNIARIHTREATPASKASYLSEIHDALFPARWGRVSIVSEGSLAIEFRSGNTKRPGKLWSRWSAPSTQQELSITAPPGRYLQYRVTWPQGGSGQLHSVRVRYATLNQRPQIEEFSAIEVKNPDKNPSSRLAREKPENGNISLTWKASDPNEDSLVSRLFYRPLGSSRWTPLNRLRPLSEPKFTWPTQTVPDGWYLLKLEISDEQDNPGDSHLKAEVISSPVLIDNHRPTVESIQFNWIRDGGQSRSMVQVTGVALDDHSSITRVEYSIDAGPWKTAAVKDNLYDQQQENFLFDIREIEPGFHALTLRVWDAAGNFTIVQQAMQAP